MNRLIIDTDAGVDDAQAIMMALAHPETRVEAITTVTGNVHVDQVAKNVPKILDVCSADIPFFIGADRPLVARHVDAAHVHGDDGLGNTNLPESSRKPAPEHAVNALIRLINENPDEYTLIALGPLTNLALAVRLDPSLPQKLKRLVIMGGTIGAHGNATTVAEYNFFADPESVQVVLDTFGESAPFPELISWETTLAHCMDWDWYTEWCAYSNIRSETLGKISANFVNYLKAENVKEYALPDPLAMAITLDPTIIEKQSDRYCAMELGGQYARGQLIVDWRRTQDGVTRDGYTPNLTLIEKINMDGFRRLLNAAAQ